MFEFVHSATMIAPDAITGQDEIASTAYQIFLRLTQTRDMKNTREIFGRGVDRLRIQRGVSKKELALATGIDGGNLNRIISGQQWPGDDKIDALAAYFGVAPSQIFRYGEGAQSPYLMDSDAVTAALQKLLDTLGHRVDVQSTRPTTHHMEDTDESDLPPSPHTPYSRR